MPLTSSTRSARFSVAPARYVYWVVTTYSFCVDVGEVDQPDSDMLAVLAKGHRPLAGKPGGELLVGLDQTVAANAHNDGAELVEDIIRTVGFVSNLWVQPDQRLAQVTLDKDFVRLAWEVLSREKEPSEVAESFANEGLNSIRLCKKSGPLCTRGKTFLCRRVQVSR